MVAVPDVHGGLFFSAVAHNILLVATSTVVVMVVVFIYCIGGYSSWILWLDSCEQVYM